MYFNQFSTEDQIKMSYSIEMLSIRIDTSPLVQQHQIILCMPKVTEFFHDVCLLDTLKKKKDRIDETLMITKEASATLMYKLRALDDERRGC